MYTSIYVWDVNPVDIKIHKSTSKIDTIPKGQKSYFIEMCDTIITLN
jgi:hypothetical protein